VLKLCRGCATEYPASVEFFYRKKNRHGNPSLSFQCITCEKKRGGERWKRVFASRPKLSFEAKLSARFLKFVDKQDGPVPPHQPSLGPCLLWRGAKARKGYGKLSVCNRPRVATHVAWFLETGEWPRDQVLHKCDNPSCVRRSHLFEGDNAANIADCVAKGRMGNRFGAERLTKLSNDDVRLIRLRVANGEKHASVASTFNVNSRTISKIARGERRAKV
jgi:hypothetical protein